MESLVGLGVLFYSSIVLLIIYTIIDAVFSILGFNTIFKRIYKFLKENQ